jgi:thiamine-phosphate diphosphorylase
VTDEQLAARLRLYLVADPDQSAGDLADQVEAALRGGVTSVQLRWKSATDRELLEEAKTLAAMCKVRGALFFVNDRVDIALASGADGVHLGVDDLPIEDARRLGGPSLVLGYSPETDEQANLAKLRGADYLGVGPVFGTASKRDAGPAIGREILTRRVATAGIPVIGIGGITADNASQVISSGAVGVAVVSAILRAADAEQAARRPRQAVGP